MRLDESELLVCALCRPEHLEEVWAEFKMHIEDKMLLSLLEAAWKYKRITKGMLSRQALYDMVIDSPKKDEFLALYDDIVSRQCSGEKCAESFAWKVAKFHNAYRESEVGKALAASMETLTTGYAHNKTLMKGPEAAVRVFTDLSAATTFTQTSVMDIRSERFRDGVQRAYAENKTSGKAIFTGFKVLDEHTLGVMKSNLVLVAAYANEGKSFALLNMGHFSQTGQGLNVAIATGEMSANEYIARYLSRHSYHVDRQNAIKTRAIERGLLTPTEERQLFNVVIPDLVENPAYGKLYLWAFTQRETVDSLVRRCMALPDKIDVLVVDYLSLLTPFNRRAQRWEEVNDIIREAKASAISAYNGEGLVLYSGFQTKRIAWEQAQQTGKYTKTAFAESAEAERSADLAFWLLDRSQGVATSDGKAPVLQAGVMKYRHGSLLSEFSFSTNFDYAYMETNSGATTSGARTG